MTASPNTRYTVEVRREQRHGRDARPHAVALIVPAEKILVQALKTLRVSMERRGAGYPKGILKSMIAAVHREDPVLH